MWACGPLPIINGDYGPPIPFFWQTNGYVLGGGFQCTEYATRYLYAATHGEFVNQNDLAGEAFAKTAARQFHFTLTSSRPGTLPTVGDIISEAQSFKGRANNVGDVAVVSAVNPGRGTITIYGENDTFSGYNTITMYSPTRWVINPGTTYQYTYFEWIDPTQHGGAISRPPQHPIVPPPQATHKVGLPPGTGAMPAPASYRVIGLIRSQTLPVRHDPSLSSPVLGHLHNGQRVRVLCQTTGFLVAGRSRIWDEIGAGRYVSDYYVDTPAVGKFSAGIPRCPGQPGPTPPVPVARLLTVGTAIDSGNLVAVSCVSHTFCMALGNNSADVFYGNQWGPAGNPGAIDSNSGPGLGTFGGKSVSCASTTNCAAIDTTGHTLVWNGSIWGPPVPTFPGALGGAEVSCATVSFCLAVAAHGNSDTELQSTFNGSTWTTPAPTGVPHRIESLTCVTKRLCMATDSKGNLLIDNSGNWTIPKLSLQGKAEAVSCVIPTFCMVVGGLNDAWTYDGRRWSAPHRFNEGPIETETVSCMNSTTCLVAGTAIAAQAPISLALDSNNHWTTARTSINIFGGFSGLTCPTTSFCMAVEPVLGPNPDDVWWTAPR